MYDNIIIKKKLGGRRKGAKTLTLDQEVLEYLSEKTNASIFVNDILLKEINKISTMNEYDLLEEAKRLEKERSEVANKIEIIYNKIDVINKEKALRKEQEDKQIKAILETREVEKINKFKDMETIKGLVKFLKDNSDPQGNVNFDKLIDQIWEQFPPTKRKYGTFEFEKFWEWIKGD